MPFRRFRSLQEMEDSLWRAPGDPELWRAIERVWDFAERTCPRCLPPGVHKHRSLGEAQAMRDEWEEKDFREFWRRQRAAGTAVPPLSGEA